jgi:hypothetical protein
VPASLMDFSYTICSGSRTTGAEDEDWLSYLDLDDSELHLQIDEVSSTQLLNTLETSESLDRDFILPGLDLDDQPHGSPVVPIPDTCRTEASLSKRDRAHSINRASLNSSALDRPPRKKTRKARFTSSQNDVLETWLTCHISYPYTQKKEKEDLAAATGLTVGQIQTWFARTRNRKLRPQINDLLHPSEAEGASETNVLTRRPHDSGNISPATQSRGGSSARFSIGPRLSSLLAVAPASPQLGFSDKEFDSGVWECQRQDSASVHRYWESSAPNEACKVNWWLGTLPDRMVDYQLDCVPEGNYFSYSTETSNSIGSVNPSSTLVECRAVVSTLRRSKSILNLRSAYQCSPVSIRDRDYMSQVPVWAPTTSYPTNRVVGGAGTCRLPQQRPAVRQGLHTLSAGDVDGEC